MEVIEDFKYLWEENGDRYVLIQTQIDGNYETCVVYDCVNKCGVLIDDDTLSREIKHRMFLNGVQMVASIPR